jgi:hypothetical protein
MYRDNIAKNYKHASHDDARALWENEYRYNSLLLRLIHVSICTIIIAACTAETMAFTTASSSSQLLLLLYTVELRSMYIHIGARPLCGSHI